MQGLARLVASAWVCEVAAAVCFAFGVAARLTLLRSSLATTLADDLILATPAASLPCRREGLYLMSRGHDPLAPEGGCAQVPPVLIVTLAALEDAPLSQPPPHVQQHALLAADTICALLLYLSAPVQAIGVVAAAVHLLSPWTVAGCAAGSSAMLHGLVALAAAHLGARGWTLASALALAVGVMLTPDALWLSFALAALAAATSAPSRTGTASLAAKATAVLRFGSAAGLAICALLALLAPSFGGVAHLLRRTVGAWLAAEPILYVQPNVGLWWYLLGVAFLPLRPTFVAAMHSLPRLCVVGLALRLPTHMPRGRRLAAPPRDPASPPSLLGVALAHAVITTTKLAPTLPEIVLAFAFVGAQLDGPLRECMGNTGTFGALALVLGALACGPLLSGWLDARQVNANFFYAATVLLGAGQMSLIYDITAAALLRDAEAVAVEGLTKVQRAWRGRPPRERTRATSRLS